MNGTQKHSLHQDWIDPSAVEIVRRLQERGFTTYLVGGCVRDLLAGFQPKDFDIATLAHPQNVKDCVPRAYIIGKRFRLVLAKRGDKQFEIATFRRNTSNEELGENEEAAPSGDNVFGTPPEDAQRRDFTLNSLFYDPIADQLIDYNNGIRDIEERVVRMIGDPDTRLIEDPIRILRALRLAHKLGFSIDPALREAMKRQAHSLKNAVLPRKREEILKILRLKDPALAFEEAYDLDILAHLSPTLHTIYQNSTTAELFRHYLGRIGKVAINHDSPAELFGFLTMAYVRAQGEDLGAQGDVDTDQLTDQLFESEPLLGFLKNELGMFRHEQSLVAKSIQMQRILTKTDEFKKRGYRRQLALLKHEALPLSFLLAQSDCLLSASELSYWLDTYKKALPEIETMRQSEDAQPKKKWQRRSGRSRRSPPHKTSKENS